MVTASIVIDLTAESEDFSTDKRKVYAADLENAPDGTRVIVLVGARSWSIDNWVIETLHQLADRLHIDVRASDVVTAERWHTAIRTGRIGVIA